MIYEEIIKWWRNEPNRLIVDLASNQLRLVDQKKLLKGFLLHYKLKKRQQY